MFMQIVATRIGKIRFLFTETIEVAGLLSGCGIADGCSVFIGFSGTSGNN